MKALFFSWLLGILCVSGSVDGEFRFKATIGIVHIVILSCCYWSVL